MRCLKRRLSDVVYRQLVRDAHQPGRPGRTLGGGSSACAAGYTPHTGTSDKSLPGPAPPTSTPHTTPTT